MNTAQIIYLVLRDLSITSLGAYHACLSSSSPSDEIVASGTAQAARTVKDAAEVYIL